MAESEPLVVATNEVVPEGAGFVYVLVNRSMPGLVKIGKTIRSSEERADELSATTGVPTPFEVAYEVLVSDCCAAEIALHAQLAQFRVNEDREFFSLPLKTAIIQVIEITRPFSQ